MVLVTFRFIGLAHLHTLWGCLAFVGFPSEFGLVCLGLCPLGFLFPVFFAGLFAPLVWSGRLDLPTPWSRLFPLRPSAEVCSATRP